MADVAAEKLKEKLRSLDAVLLKLSSDEDLQDDLQLQEVKTAIDHWTGKNRLPMDKAAQLQNNRRVVYVLQRFQMLQSVCQSLGMPVPLDHLLLCKSKLDDEIKMKLFGALLKGPGKDVSSQPSKGKMAEPKEIKSGNVKDSATVAHDSVNNNNITAKLQSTTDKITESGAQFDINHLLKIGIGLTVVLIAITLSILLK